MQNKLQELTDKLYNEGLAKGKQEGEELLAKAKMKKFKDTFAILSKELNIPIVPIAIAGSESACYGSSIIPKFRKKIDIEVLDPIMPDSNQSVESLRDKVAKKIEKCLS